MHYLDLYYMAMSNPHHHLHFTWSMLLFCRYWWRFSRRVMKASGKDAIVAHRDPQLHASMNYDNF